MKEESLTLQVVTRGVFRTKVGSKHRHRLTLNFLTFEGEDLYVRSRVSVIGFGSIGYQDIPYG